MKNEKRIEQELDRIREYFANLSLEEFENKSLKLGYGIIKPKAIEPLFNIEYSYQNTLYENTCVDLSDFELFDLQGVA